MARNSHHKITVEERERASREVVQSYIATTAMYDFNVYEKRVLYNLVKLAQSQLEGVRLSENLFRIDHSLKGFVLIELPISYFLTDSEDKNHVRIKEALKSLHQKTFTYKDEEVWECFSIIANPKIQMAFAYLGSQARVCRCDKQGRLPLDRKKLEAIGVDGQLKMIGAITHIRLSAPQNWIVPEDEETIAGYLGDIQSVGNDAAKGLAGVLSSILGNR